MRRKALVLIPMFVLFFGLIWPKAQASVSVNVNLNFVSGYYVVPQPTAMYYESRLNSWEDVSTLFFLSRLTGYSPSVLLGWRLGGKPWIAIAQRLNVPSSVFYVPSAGSEDFFENREGPPYGHAWGYWRKHGPKSLLVLDDEAIRNRVVLLGTSRYYHIQVNEELGLVAGHRTSFGAIVAKHEGEKGRWSRFDRAYFLHGQTIPLYAPSHDHGQGWEPPGHRHGASSGNESSQGWGNHGHGDHGHGHGHDRADNQGDD